MERKGLEFGVGIFLIVGLFCLAYLSIKLGNLGLGSSNYEVNAMFPTVSGLKEKAMVTMAGVPIGNVRKIQLKNGQAEVTLGIEPQIQLEEDSIASIKTMGIIGDKYISITPGGSDAFIQPGGIIRETQPPIDVEGLISKFVFGSLDKEEKPQKGENAEALPSLQ